MPRYSAQFRNSVLKKLLLPEGRSALSLAREYNISVATIYGWKAKMRDGTLQIEDGVQANRSRQLAEKLSLLLESRSVADDTMGEWLRENGLHSQHLTVWEQEVRDAVTKNEQEAREELKAARKKIREQERELTRKEKALAEAAIIITAQKKISRIFQDQEED
ncbi:Transposase [Alkalispirochaeta americana]|uniref:Transposase n=1 Tax=Alkalispirochaeta americana TaxID=159291 RepID=A0A1N6UNL9_9SPIO|nr:transposase [Alkalispirochaeta americana]SIQ66896.1 Transposase [Alkalispirochaeta americana]